MCSIITTSLSQHFQARQPCQQGRRRWGTPCKEEERKGKGKTSIQLVSLFHIILFQCHICNKYPKKGEGMYKHIRSHKLASPLKCGYAGCNAVKWYIQRKKVSVRLHYFIWDNFRRQQRKMLWMFTFSSITSHRRKVNSKVEWIQKSPFKW